MFRLVKKRDEKLGDEILVDVLSGGSCGSEFYVRKPNKLHTIGKISVRRVDWYQIWTKKLFLS